MIDRTTFDVRFDAHATGMERINRAAWRQEGETGRSIRAMVASALVALATRLDAAVSPVQRRETTLTPTSAA